LPLRLYVLLVGSYQSCAYLFRNLHKSRSRMLRRSSKIASEASRAETATLHWSELTLGQEEFHMLLVGLIQDNKPDRYPLWEVIASQLERGQPRRWKYFVMALYYANTKALEELLRLGWNANGGSLLYFCPPLSFAKYLRSHNTFYPTTHSESLYPRLKSQKQKGLEENVRLLQQHSSRHMPPWFKFLLNWYIVLAVAAYVLVIPLTAAYTFHPKCLTRSQFLGRLWTVSVIAGVAPPLIGFFVPATMYNLPGAGRSSLISSYTFLLLLWLFHHFVLPYVIFRTCVGDGIYWIILPEFCVAAIILIGIIG
jgi:hypothetical protein